jgi:DNA-directed RNA polymerase sigma subunit (sigma70/sigma32)
MIHLLAAQFDVGDCPRPHDDSQVGDLTDREKAIAFLRFGHLITDPEAETIIAVGRRLLLPT